MDNPTYHAYEPLDSTHGGARKVVEAEFDHIEAWRGRRPRAGLALSGGGIRSASFGLGALQAMAHWKVLPAFDYLSTVSGGGYIGASFTFLLQQSIELQHKPGNRVPKFDVSPDRFPYISYPMVGAAPPVDDRAASQGRLLRRLRQNASYLSPGRGITIVSLAAVWVRNCLATVLVHGALLVMVLLALLDGGLLPGPAGGANPVLLAGGAALLAYLGLSLAFVVATHVFEWLPRPWHYTERRLYERCARWLLIGATGLLAFGALPVIHAFIDSGAFAEAVVKIADNHRAAPTTLVGALLAIAGTLGNYLGALQIGKAKRSRVSVNALVAVASSLLLLGVLLLAFVAARWLFDLQASVSRERIFGGLAGVLLLLGWLPDVNFVSTHRYYRDRLMEAFLPDLEHVFTASSREPSMKTTPGNETMLRSLCGRGRSDDGAPSLMRGPYHLLNANVVLVASTIPRYRGRGGDSFILSPMFSGSRATGWRAMDDSTNARITLASAMAISGAAVNPNAGAGGKGVTRQPVLSALMGMFNVRLGYWFRNPDPKAAPRVPLQANPNLINPGLSESLGRENLREDRPYVLLTDGGHFENLGLYELVRRRLELIVVCDASADPKNTFADLANAVEKVRADFGAIIDLCASDLAPLVPRKVGDARKGPAFAERGFLVAGITYSRRAGQGEHVDKGLLVYMTTTFFAGLSADLHGYRAAHPAFPDEPTSDQFFDEKQFEAYRELGFQTVQDVLEVDTVRQRFADLVGQPVAAPRRRPPRGGPMAPDVPVAGAAVSIEIDLAEPTA